MRAVITTENDDYDITSKIQVLNTASAASGGPSLYTARVVFGDSVKDLDGTGGTFELYIEVDGIPIEPYPQEIKFSTETSTSVFTAEFWAGNSEDIDVYVKSPNAGDSDVDVTVTLLDVSPLQSVTRGYDTAISSTGVIQADVAAISGDTDSANNLELMYDGTGYTDETGPASRSQVSNLGVGSAGALPFSMTDDNVDGALKGVTFVGTQTAGTFLTTGNDPATYQQIDNNAGNLDIVYQVDVGGDRQCVDIVFKGYLDKKGRTATIRIYDHVGVGWDIIETLTGTDKSENTTISNIPLAAKYTGTGAELGNVYIRFTTAAQADADLYVGTLHAISQSTSYSIGYAAGAIWVDTLNGTTNTEVGVDGVADNPATWAAAITLNATLGLDRFHIASSSVVTLTGDSTDYTFFGEHPWTLILDGQIIEDISVEGAVVSGIGTCGAGEAYFKSCHIGDCTLGKSHFNHCGCEGKLTLSDAELYILHQCFAGDTGGAPPEIDFGAAVGDSTVGFRDWAGGIKLINLGANGTDKCTIQGMGKVTVDTTCVGGTIGIQGNMEITDNVVGGFLGTLNDLGRVDQPAINTEADTALTDNLNIDAGVVEANIKEVGDVGITDIDDFKANLTTLEQFASADWKINTSDATQYQIVFYAAGTVTEIARKDLFDSDGNSVIALTTPIASMTKA